MNVIPTHMAALPEIRIDPLQKDPAKAPYAIVEISEVVKVSDLEAWCKAHSSRNYSTARLLEAMGLR